VATETLNDIVVPGPEATFTLPPGGSMEVTGSLLKPGETARGVLLDAQGRPVHVNTWLTEPTFLLRPGAPTSVGDIPPGVYKLRASLPGGRIAEKPLEIVSGAMTTVSLP